MSSILFGFLTNYAIIFSVIAVTFVKYLWPNIAEEKRKGKFLGRQPGPRRLPLFGNALELAKPREEFMPTLMSWFKKHGYRFIAKIGPSWRIFIANAKDLEIILKSQVEITKSVEYERMIPWIGLGLLTSTGEKWSKRRKMLTPSFHFKILEEFVEIFNVQSDTLVDILKTECCHDKVFDISSYLNRCTLDIICETAMGTKVDAQRDRNSPYVRAISRLSYLQVYRALRPWVFPKLLWQISPSGREETKMLKIVHEFTNRVIQERKQGLDSSASTGSTYNLPGERKRKLAFLDTLIEAQKIPENDLTDENIREETDTFMFEGHDTTASSTNFTVFLLAAHPKIQERVQEELNEIFQNDYSRPITTQDLSHMKYLECCLKESLRIYPSVALVGRALQNDLRFDENLTAPKGAILVLCPYFLHRDATVFPDPEKFIPERFLPENVEGRDPFAYLPFVAGPRNCIGQKFALMEEKIIIANLFRHFTIQAAEKQEDLVIVSDLVTRSMSGIQVKLTPRV